MVTEPELTNAELDTKVLEIVQSGIARAAKIQAQLLLGPNASRVLDRSLQRLRKRGAIQYGSKSGWRPA